MTSLRAHLDAALSIIDRVRSLHHQDGNLCMECTESHGVLWPCPTIQVLNTLDAEGNSRTWYAREVESSIGLHTGAEAAVVYAARDAVLAVRDQELEDLRTRLADLTQRVDANATSHPAVAELAAIRRALDPNDARYIDETVDETARLSKEVAELRRENEQIRSARAKRESVAPKE
ncbi:hypothetical protein [Streptomyces sp. NPDC087272]|uniref:hypothetical protein n=1 Tax=Streptomyces sp. NPDC087272 TaxID=3365775 RepID=UPI00382722DA